MKGSSTLLFIGLGSALLLAFAWKRGAGASSRPAMTPGGAATGGTARPAPAKPKQEDPLKALQKVAESEAKKYAQARGEQALKDWFAGSGGP